MCIERETWILPLMEAHLGLILLAFNLFSKITNSPSHGIKVYPSRLTSILHEIPHSSICSLLFPSKSGVSQCMQSSQQEYSHFLEISLPAYLNLTIWFGFFVNPIPMDLIFVPPSLGAQLGSTRRILLAKKITK